MKKGIPLVLIILTLLVGCNTKTKDEVGVDSSLNSSTESQEDTLQSSSNCLSSQEVSKRTKQTYDQLSKDLKIDSNSEKMSVNQLESISGRVGSLAIREYEGFEFNNIKDIPIKYFRNYIEMVAVEQPFYDELNKEAEKQQGPIQLNYKEIMQILKYEFGLEEYPWNEVPVHTKEDTETFKPFKSTNKEKIMLDISPRAPGPNAQYDIMNTVKKGDIITVKTRVYILDEVSMLEDKEKWPFVDMEYCFKVKDENSAYVVSGKKIK